MIYANSFEIVMKRDVFFFILENEVFYSYEHQSTSESLIIIYDLREFVENRKPPQPQIMSMISNKIVYIPKDRNTILYHLQRSV